jgi:hypothetical protein
MVELYIELQGEIMTWTSGGRREEGGTSFEA